MDIQDLDKVYTVEELRSMTPIQFQAIEMKAKLILSQFLTEDKIVTIWSSISNGKEVWRWTACYEDGSGNEGSWAFTLATCKRHAPAIKGRYKRVKDKTKQHE